MKEMIAFIVFGGLLIAGLALATGRAVDRCEQRGGVYHCVDGSGFSTSGHYVSTQTCDCYNKNGTLLLGEP